MSEVEKNEGTVIDPTINDFSDLGKSTKFKFNDTVFEIPAISKSKSRELMQIGRKVNREIKTNERKRKKLDKLNKELENEGITEERENDIYDEINTIEEEIYGGEAVLNVQTEFLICAIPNLTIEILDNWPNTVIGKVTSLIYAKISGDEIKEEEKKA